MHAGQENFIEKALNSKWYDANTDTISLFGSDTDLPTPAFIEEAVKRGLDEGRMSYGNVRGDHDILEIICEKLKTANKLSVTTDNICIVPGARFGFYLTSLCFLKSKEEAIMVGAPAHPCLVDSNNSIGAATIWNHLRKNDFKIDVEDLQKK